jgi:hypothetical protein
MKSAYQCDLKNHQGSPLTSGLKAESSNNDSPVLDGVRLSGINATSTSMENGGLTVLLPIEFARQSNDGRITLVLAQGCEPVPTLWSLFNTRDLIDPRESLRNECGCATLKLCSLPARLPIILKFATQVAAPEGNDGIGPAHGPEHP